MKNKFSGMNRKKSLFLVVYLTLILIIGILPVYIPITINDYSKENWNGKDLTGKIGEMDDYYNSTYLELEQPINLNAYDLRGASYEKQLALTTLQGLINRNNVSLFLIFRYADLLWLNDLNSTYRINYTLYNESYYWNFFLNYQSFIDGLIVYDDTLIDTVNAATFLSGIYDCIVVHESLLEDLSDLGITDIKYDLRDEFGSKIELYEWVWDNFHTHATERILSCYDPEQISFRDYIVAAKIFTFYLSGGPIGPKEEVDLFKKILSEYPENTPIIGWFTDPAGQIGEYESVKLISKMGDYSLCAAIPDLTVYSSVKLTSLKQKEDSFDASDYELENKIYVTLIVSDGDNVNYCAEHLRNLWSDGKRGAVPIGITLEPALFKIFPTCLNYYYQSANENISFLAGPSGSGYCYVDLNPSIEDFLGQTQFAMDKSDLNQVWLLNGYEAYQNEFSEEVLEAYTSEECDLKGIFLNYHDYPSKLGYVKNKVPVFESIFVEEQNELVGKLQALKSTHPDEPVFLFVGFWAWDFSFTKLKGAADQLGKDFVFMRPDQFAELFIEYQKNNKFNEIITFFVAGIIPLVAALIGLLYLGFSQHKRALTSRRGNRKNFNLDNHNGQKSQKINENTDNCKTENVPTTIRPERNPTDFKKSILNYSMFFLIDVQVLLIAKIFLYSTILNLLYFAIFVVSIYTGTMFKGILDKSLGSNTCTILVLALFSIGNILFYLAPMLVIFVGFSIGALIQHQIQSSSSFLRTNASNKRGFIYLLTSSATFIMLFNYEVYYILFLIITIVSCVLCGTIIYNLVKESKDDDRIPQVQIARHVYFKSVILGLLFYFLLVPTYSLDNIYYFLLWGVQFYPARLTLALNVAACYLGAILLTELIKQNKYINSLKVSQFLLILALSSYIVLPLFFNGPFFFILTNFLFIFGVLNFCASYFEKNTVSYEKGVNVSLKDRRKGTRFIGQSIFWMFIGSFLFFIPPPILIADSQDIFVNLEIEAITQFVWPSFVWWMFYVPSMRMLLIIPLILLLLVYAALELFYKWFFQQI